MTLIFMSTYSLSCEKSKMGSVSIYSASCQLNLTSKHSENIFAQIKFSKKSKNTVINELKKLRKLTYHEVAAHAFDDGYRLLIGPLSAEQIPRLKRYLLRYGYKDVMLKSFVNIPLTDIKPPLPTKLYYSPLGHLGKKAFYVPVNAEKTAIRLAYAEAFEACAALGQNARMANAQEYVKILWPKMTAFLLSSIEVPFWLTPSAVVTKVAKEIEKRQASRDTKYQVVCTFYES